MREIEEEVLDGLFRILFVIYIQAILFFFVQKFLVKIKIFKCRD